MTENNGRGWLFRLKTYSDEGWAFTLSEPGFLSIHAENEGLAWEVLQNAVGGENISNYTCQLAPANFESSTEND